ncbi:MAG TPA: hypothetical protein PK323_04270 [Bacteroidia bacterium]|nr:hypothetical protein [Bacteroidia bacterium]
MKSKFENVNVYGSTFGALKRRAAVTIPGVGIFVHPIDINNTDLLRHEFGHFLQFKELGFIKFIFKIALKSLISASKANQNKDYKHMSCETEWLANKISYEYFNAPKDWNFNDYPISPN